MWIRLENIIDIQTGASFKKDVAIQESKDNYTRVLRGGNINPFNFELKPDDLYIPSYLVNKSIYLNKNDLITPAVTSLENIGKIAAVINEIENVTVGGFVYLFRPYFCNVNLSIYLLNIMSSPTFLVFMKEITKKSGQAFYNMNKERLKRLFIPLAPYKEQIRIINKINSFHPLINQYDKLEKQLTKLENEITDRLKKSILQYAIEGKLVKQNPNDEPASVLLERIKAEKEKLIKEGKIKRDKNESYIYQGDDKNYYEQSLKDTKPLLINDYIFDIPSSWYWCTISQLSKLITDGTHKTPSYTNAGIPFLSIQNISSGKFNLNNLKYISIQEHNCLKNRCLPENGDLLICRIGTLGKVIINNLDFEYSIFVSLGLIKLVEKSLNYYIKISLNSPNSTKFIDYVKVGGGTHTYKLNIEDINKFPIPLPPFAEQERIVNKIERLFSML